MGQQAGLPVCQCCLIDQLRLSVRLSSGLSLLGAFVIIRPVLSCSLAGKVISVRIYRGLRK